MEELPDWGFKVFKWWSLAIHSRLQIESKISWKIISKKSNLIYRAAQSITHLCLRKGNEQSITICKDYEYQKWQYSNQLRKPIKISVNKNSKIKIDKKIGNNSSKNYNLWVLEKSNYIKWWWIIKYSYIGNTLSTEKQFNWIDHITLNLIKE
jgi:hypothetical protein